MSETDQNSHNNTTTETTPIVHIALKNDLKFLIIPLIVMIVVMILSALVYLMAKRKRLKVARENLMHLYEFDSHENEWDMPLLSSSEENVNSASKYGATSL